MIYTPGRRQLPSGTLKLECWNHVAADWAMAHSSLAATVLVTTAATQALATHVYLCRSIPFTLGVSILLEVCERP